LWNDHEQAKARPAKELLQQIVDFESQVYAAQTSDLRGGSLVVPGGPPGLGISPQPPAANFGWGSPQSRLFSRYLSPVEDRISFVI
jgi:hypothetical protein